jgi:cellobiose phosphorylase
VRGQGESVWLGWFLATCLQRFAYVCDTLGEATRAQELRAESRRIGERTDAAAWDGAWYVRAFDDDGKPFGSAASRECRIDALPQAWSVLSHAGSAEHRKQALESAWEALVRPHEQIAVLLTPPFDRTTRDPGYIKAYPPGVRENGGQYTHAAVWLAWALAEAGETERAWSLCRMLCPARHAARPADVTRYRVEPYVLAADVYGPPLHTGRGGWTWYTGAASWYRRFIVEALLGIRWKAEEIVFHPLLPADWDGFEATLRHGTTTWHVRVRRDTSIEDVEVDLDGIRQPGRGVARDEDGGEHVVSVRTP